MAIQLLWHSIFSRFFTDLSSDHNDLMQFANYSLNQQKHKDENLCLLKLKIECNIILNSKSFSILWMKIEHQFQFECQIEIEIRILYLTVDYPSWISQDLTWPYFMDDLVFLLNILQLSIEIEGQWYRSLFYRYFIILGDWLRCRIKVLTTKYSILNVMFNVRPNSVMTHEFIKCRYWPRYNTLCWVIYILLTK